MAFEVGTIELSMKDVSTGNPLTANYYTVDGIVDDYGNPRPLSIGQLVMAICLERATELEAEIIEMMEAMSQTTLQLEVLTDIQEVIANNPDSAGNLTLEGHQYDITNWPLDYAGKGVLGSWSELRAFLTASEEDGGAACTGITDSSSAEEVVSAISSALDGLNTVSQEDMIELQSLTNKRDQSYDLISNVLKSFNTVMTTNANNL